MNISEHDEGVLEVLVERLEKQRLPRMLELQKRVDSGAVLNEFDIEYLKSAIEDATTIKPLIDKYPQYQELAMKMISLYKDVSEKALLNENKN